jgi:hypothetical protein
MKMFLAGSLALTLMSANAHADCTSEIQAMMQAHLKAGPYHVTMDTDMEGASQKMEADVILPNSFHMKAPQMEAVMLKQGTWMKMGGKWMAMPAAASNMMSQSIKTGMDTGMANLKNVQCLGSQQFEGKTYTGYAFDSSGEAMGIKASSHITAYETVDGLPAVMVIDGEAMGKKSKMVQHITYDPSITITPPM